MNPLIAIPSPRDIPKVIQALGQVNKEYDLLWLKYMPEFMAYETMRKQFLNHPSEKYTHLVICPDDLIISKDKLQILLDDYDKCLDTHERYNTIMSGYCNVDRGDYAQYANITIDKVSPLQKGRIYKWVTLNNLENVRKAYDDYPKVNNYKKKYLLKVKFAGFPLFVIPRKIVEHIPFRNDSPEGNLSCGCFDVMFCHDALKEGYQIYVDTRVGNEHLKINDKETGKLIKDLPLQKPHIRYEYAEKKIMVN